ncbi:hypothetical protein EXIGLDRAFT_378423 [Exidia glandulosa HHB12029]|uniref:Uncharacterized protein n=1 Tax=Exidia glandulosa HHB12029 TaxID=1314781 RepID=A0A165L4Q5_EXIGL|nr:hypothetical protein EXIGLDRAFT_378423 [Exidia glandulosa HHB12029]
MSDSASSDDDARDGLMYGGGRPMTIEQKLASQSRYIAAFLDAPTDSLPLWEPTTVRDDVPAWNDDDVNRLRESRIPATSSSSVPDLGLYSIGHLDRLDPSFPETLDNFTRGNEHIFLSNAAGTGKTRLLAETLIHNWGFYFTCCNGSGFSQYGSLDLADAMSVLRLRPFDASGLYPRIILSRRLNAAALGELRHNQCTARRPFLWVLLSRLLLFNEFCALYEARGIPEAQARRKWLLLQLRPKSVTRVDPFYGMSTTIRDLHLDDDDLLSRIASAMPACQDRITFVAIDEAQVPQTRFETSFATANPYRLQHAPLLRELIKCFGEHLPQKRFIISSHRLDLPLVEEALSAAHARTNDVRHFYALGSVETVEKASSYIRHFLPEASDDDCRFIFAWTRGRCVLQVRDSIQRSICLPDIDS